MMMENKEDKYQQLADCIRSDQLSAKQVMAEFNEDPEFAIWYKKKYTSKYYTNPQEFIMKHNADFRYDLEWGQIGENTVADIVAGDKTEVKSERDIWLKTGNHFVETESRGKPSGICTHRLLQLVLSTVDI